MREVEVRFPPVWPVFTGATVLLALAAWSNAAALNADAIAYLRLAGYYADGRPDLAVSGYWGPLLSWGLAPLLKAGLAPLPAARLAMAGSALVFLAGVWAVLRAFVRADQRSRREPLLTPGGARLGLILAAGGAVSWSVEYISPDLLQGGLWLLGLSVMVDERWRSERRRAVGAGGWLGAAYLAKSVALPLGVASVIGLWWWQRRRQRAEGAGRAEAGEPTALRAWRQPGLTLAVMVLIAAPWMVVISAKYARPTFSTSARIAHAVVGPHPAERGHPFGRTFHHPAPGRITAWEDPSDMPYRYWSPFESGAAFWHQLAVCREHARTVLELLRSFDWLLLGPLACLYGAVRFVRRGGTTPGNSWLAAAIPLAWLGAVYLPVYLGPMDQRYLYAAWPLLYVLAGGCLEEVARRTGERAVSRRLFRWLPWASFGLPAGLALVSALVGYANPAAEAAVLLAKRLEMVGRTGPIAGSGFLYGGRTGLYVAYLTGQPWLGDEPDADAERYARTGARLVLVPRQGPVAEQLAASGWFADLDPALFADREEAARFPLRVFERVAASAPGG
jgi:hypothetical protein